MSPTPPDRGDEKVGGPGDGTTATSDREVVAQARDFGLSLSRGGDSFPVLRGIDLEIKRGEIIGLAGESGSGKSVFGLSLLGLLPPESDPQISGELSVDGVDMTRPEADLGALRDLRRNRLGAVFQDPMTSLDPTMRIGKQMLEVVDTEAEAVALLDAVGVPGAARRLQAYPHELSGGLRQRTMIAMAIAGEPKLIVADEPTTALDVTVQAQILALLEGLRSDLGCSVLLITHDLGVASQIADRVVVMYGGRIAETAPTGDLLGAPRHPYTSALMESRLDLDSDRLRRLKTLPGEPPDPRELPPGCPFGPRCQHFRPDCAAQLPPLEGDGVHLDACVRRDELGVLDASEVGDAWPTMPAPDRDKPALRAENLFVDVPRRGLRRRKRADAPHILAGVDLVVDQGESIAVVGESGSGKTTFIRTVAGLMSASSGVLEVAEEHPQVIFQDAGASLTPWLKVGEQIADRLRPLGLSKEERRKRIDEAFSLVGLPSHLADVRPAAMSGGQRQRVAIARAVVEPPSLLLCDEPTSALDVSVAASALNLLGDLRRKLDMALIFVTHDLAVARLVADRIAVMYLGRIVEIGPADTLMHEAVHPYTKKLLASVPGPGATHELLPGEPPNLFSPPSGCAFHPRCSHAREVCERRAPNMVPVAGIHEVDCVLAEDS